MSLFPNLSFDKFIYGKTCDSPLEGAPPKRSKKGDTSESSGRLARSEMGADIAYVPVLQRMEMQGDSSVRTGEDRSSFLKKIQTQFEQNKKFISVTNDETAKLIGFSKSTLEKFLADPVNNTSEETLKKILQFNEMVSFLKLRNRQRKYAVVPLFRSKTSSFGELTPIEFAERVENPIEKIFGIFKRIFE